MSGFVGIVNFDKESVDRELLQSMLERIAFLGPDASANVTDGSAGFGHVLFRAARESENEQQPITVNQVTVVGDARIDARDGLVHDLCSAGQNVSLTSPDINLVLAAYLAWGQTCLQHLIGDFAFIVWDRRRKQIFCARDHFGIRPLYYAHIGSTLVISNQINPIRLHPKVSARLNEGHIADYLLFGCQLQADRSSSAFADIYRVPPAHQLCADAQGLKIERYWTLPTRDTPLWYRNEEDYVSHFMQLLNRAVKDRLRADRTVISMSGGLDSTALAAVASQLVQSGEVTSSLTALTRVYDRIHPDHEAYFASLTARKLGIPIRITSCDHYLLQEPLPLTTEPRQLFQSQSYEEALKETVAFGSVALTGYGADELFTETPLYRILRLLSPKDSLALFFNLWRYLGYRPALGDIRRYISPRLRQRRKQGSGQIDFPVWLNADFVQRLDLRARWEMVTNLQPDESHQLHPDSYRRLVLPDHHTGIELLNPFDVTPPEVTHPFLDLRLVSFVMSLPPQPWFARKYLLRRAMRDRLPREVLARRKTYLGALLTSLLQQPGTEWVDRWQATTELEKYVDRAAVPDLSSDPPEFAAALVNIRPMLLNRWLLYRNDIYN